MELSFNEPQLSLESLTGIGFCNHINDDGSVCNSDKVVFDKKFGDIVQCDVCKKN